MPDKKPAVYEGHDDFAFVSYAHADRDVALPIIAALTIEGYRVWYDDGIEKGSKYPDYIASHVFSCSCFIALLSESSKRSDWCNQEINFALDLHKDVIPVYLEDTELNLGLRMRLGNRQAMFRFVYRTDSEFLGELFAIRMLYCCLNDEGKRHRGVKQRRNEAPHNTGNQVMENSNDTDFDNRDVHHRGSFAEYSWMELRQLSHIIAEAKSDDDGLAVAKKYHLVNEDGELLGDEKSIWLKSGITASVRILGFRHDELADGTGKAGITFEFANVPMRHCMNHRRTNKDGWEKSTLRKWLNREFLELLPYDLRSSIVEVQKKTNNKGRISKNDTSVVKSTTDKLWLLSMCEVYGKLSSQKKAPWSSVTYDTEGSQYLLYANKKVSTSSYSSCQKSGADTNWWLRSPSANNSNWFHCISDNGDWHADYVVGLLGVSPGFCF